MDTNPEYGPAEDCVVNLGPLSTACRNLTDWYDRLVAGQHPEIQELDQIVTTLQLLAPVPGRVGRDIQIVIEGGRHSSRDEIIGAVERLRSVGNHTPAPPDTPSEPVRNQPARKPKRRTKKKAIEAPRQQSHLPGLGPHDDRTQEGTSQWRSS